MWAQIIRMRLKPDAEDRVQEVMDLLHQAEQPGSGLIRSTAMRDQKDPRLIYTLVVFESEEHARAREQDERRADGLAAARALMAEIFEAPEFVDLEVIVENTY